MTEPPLTVAQVAELEACSTETVRRAIRAGHLRARVLNPDARRPRYRITPDALAAWTELRDAPREPQPEPRRPVDLTPDARPSLAGLHATGVVHVPSRRGRRAA